MSDVYESPIVKNDGDSVTPQGICTPFVGVVVVIAAAAFMVVGLYNYAGAANVAVAALAVIEGLGYDC